MKCLFLNIYYEDFLKKHYETQKIKHLEYMEQWVSIQDEMFGDSDFYSLAMNRLGWDAHDLITNCRPLQRQWAKEHNFDYKGKHPIWVEQIRHYKPDVIYAQGLWLLNEETFPLINEHGPLIVGHTGMKLDNHEAPYYDLIFTTLPEQVDKFRAAGTDSHYLSLAFDPRVWERVKGQERKYDLTFVGNLTAGHSRRKEVLNALSEDLGLMQWIGTNWGMDAFRIMAQSKITVNCTIDSVAPYVGNMRMFEATGCGAMLLTDNGKNIGELFDVGSEIIAYDNPAHAVDLAKHYLHDWSQARIIAYNGQTRTFEDHTYENRMIFVKEVMEAML